MNYQWKNYQNSKKVYQEKYQEKYQDFKKKYFIDLEHNPTKVGSRC